MIRNDSDDKMYKLQELRHDSVKRTWLSFFHLTFKDAVMGEHRDSVLAVSHRWEDKNYPDPLRRQLKCIKQYLHQNPEITHVWFDCARVSAVRRRRRDDDGISRLASIVPLLPAALSALSPSCASPTRRVVCAVVRADSCMPQKQAVTNKDGKMEWGRSPEDNREFSLMLKNMSLLFLSCRVLILNDHDYISRFWCASHCRRRCRRRRRRCRSHSTPCSFAPSSPPTRALASAGASTRATSRCRCPHRRAW